MGNVYISQDDTNSYIWLTNTDSGVKIAGFQFVLSNGESCISDGIHISMESSLSGWNINYSKNDAPNNHFQLLMYSGISGNNLHLSTRDVLIATINNYNNIKLHTKFYDDCLNGNNSGIPCNVISDEKGNALEFKYITSDNILYHGRGCSY